MQSDPASEGKKKGSGDEPAVGRASKDDRPQPSRATASLSNRY